MQARVRNKLSMLARAQAFCDANPSTDAGYQALAKSLADLMTAAGTEAAQQISGQHLEQASNARRDGLRRMLQYAQLRHLARVAASAAQQVPELAAQFVMPTGRDSNQQWVTKAREMVAAAATNQELLVSLGLGATFMDDLTDVVKRLDGFNRWRFRADAEALAAWESSINVVPLRVQRPAVPGGEVPPIVFGPGSDAAPEKKVA
jgi:hypothetical protein